jgi:hypothetical protein
MDWERVAAGLFGTSVILAILTAIEGYENPTTAGIAICAAPTVALLVLWRVACYFRDR